MSMIPDILWDEISKLIPKKENNIGRPPMCPRRGLNALSFIIKNISLREKGELLMPFMANFATG